MILVLLWDLVQLADKLARLGAVAWILQVMQATLDEITEIVGLLLAPCLVAIDATQVLHIAEQRTLVLRTLQQHLLYGFIQIRVAVAVAIARVANHLANLGQLGAEIVPHLGNVALHTPPRQLVLQTRLDAALCIQVETRLQAMIQHIGVGGRHHLEQRVLNSEPSNVATWHCPRLLGIALHIRLQSLYKLQCALFVQLLAVKRDERRRR